MHIKSHPQFQAQLASYNPVLLDTCIRVKVSGGLCRLVDLVGRVQSFVAPARLASRSLQAYEWHSAHDTQHCLQKILNHISYHAAVDVEDCTALSVTQRMCAS
jgi:hypothetical protein